MRKPSFYIVITTCLSLCVIGLFTEVGFKAFSRCQLAGVVYDTRLGWRLKPNYRGLSMERDPKSGAWTLEFNSRGFRDRNSRAKSPGVRRIMFLGDSYTAGLAYPDHAIFTTIVERTLNAQSAVGTRYEVMNASVPAWATDQQYLYLKQEGLNYHPDVVVLMAAPNDVREAYGKKFLALEGDELVERSAPATPWTARVGWWLANRSCTFQYLQGRLRRNAGSFEKIFEHFPITFPVGGKMATDKHLFLRDTPEEIAAAKLLFKATLREMHRLCRENRCKLVTTVIPTKIEFDDTLKDGRYQPGKIAEEVEAMSEDEGIPFLDLVSDLKAEEKDPLQIFISSKYHLSDVGHAFVAKELLPFLIAN
jgi:hypothetical protein